MGGRTRRFGEDEDALEPGPRRRACDSGRGATSAGAATAGSADDGGGEAASLGKDRVAGRGKRERHSRAGRPGVTAATEQAGQDGRIHAARAGSGR